MAGVSDTEDGVELSEEVMDGEHAAQIRLLESFERGLLENRNKDELVIVLDRLVEFTNLHFMSEEILMQQRAYPGVGVHVKEHDSLLEQVRKIQTVFNDGDQTMTVEELKTLRAWLVDHIKTKDQAFVSFLQKVRMEEV
ncbi:bacteriohemerythrin [Telmatospirillum siberiense]|uniref:Hemerythrin-like domain-containing protein n=1 Tax=Telmatospirillum siberiense TaxID=382514 RepID=A0A2N3PS54_9PROT|nr:hemerythrin family protein [Telmatospirillum siberiense]PKU23241.1 hypothetical protein CWS72_17605 [Telmatospirillum siberiense]